MKRSELRRAKRKEKRAASGVGPDNFDVVTRWMVDTGAVVIAPNATSAGFEIYHVKTCGFLQNTRCDCAPEIRFGGRVVEYPLDIIPDAKTGPKERYRGARTVGFHDRD